MFGGLEISLKRILQRPSLKIAEPASRVLYARRDLESMGTEGTHRSQPGRKSRQARVFSRSLAGIASRQVHAALERYRGRVARAL